ncbi:BMP family ABC transporter substrate-binding protein [Granulosicoccus antarcticus]|uniref:Purine-binding protein n=1 Tax=Granulosicoccus antarcticus IMCC3135 TaxID=1192854 RepID=A0A2Z2NZA4_9GAMM|nr:BMP family ABC transporter substrate-binding protein [Granulosicoccus antarcticus]ASJ76792.1 Purine-binding protein [Granulosicoccus antarcticus IMCC3135]
MKNWTDRIRTTAMAVTVALGLGATKAQAQDAFTIGYIYPSPATDVGWAHELDRGRQAIEEKFGDKVKSIVVENIQDGPDAARIMNQMAASQGVDMMVLGSFGYMNDGLKIAKRYPDIDFIHASGYKTSKNFSTFLTRNHESAYVAGMAAGYVTKSNTIGVVAAYAIPEVVGIINGFTLGAQATNPEITVKVVWLNSWFDPSKAQESARSLIAQQSDVLFSVYQDTPSVVSVAEEEGVYVVNTSSDMKAYAPEHLLASMQISWADYFIEQVQASMDDTFAGSAFWGGMADKAVSVESLSDDLSEEQRATLDATIADITSGVLSPFVGPVFDQDGVEKVAIGENLSDNDLLSISWLVTGIETKLPK